MCRQFAECLHSGLATCEFSEGMVVDFPELLGEKVEETGLANCLIPYHLKNRHNQSILISQSFLTFLAMVF